MRKGLALILTAELVVVAIVLSAQTLTPIGQLRGRTDSSGNLYATNTSLGSGQGPLTPIANLAGRTDSSGNLYINCASGCGGSVTVDTGATNDVPCYLSATEIGPCSTGNVTYTAGTLQLKAAFANVPTLHLVANEGNTLNLTATPTVDGSGPVVVSLGGNSTNGILQAGSHATQGTVPGISGCSAGTQTGGQTAGTYASGTTGTCTVALTFVTTAAHGWTCVGNDLTTPTDVQHQTAVSTTTCTIAGTTVSGDVVNFLAMAY